MARLSDLIKQGKLPEKDSKSTKDDKDQIRIRELAELKKKKEAFVEEKKPLIVEEKKEVFVEEKTTKKQEDEDFPSETSIGREEKKAVTAVNEFEFPSEGKPKVLEKPAKPEPERPLFPGEIEKFQTEEGLAAHEAEAREKAVIDIHDELYEFRRGVLRAAKTNQKFSIDKGIELITKVIDTPDAIDDLYRKAIYRKEIKYDFTIHGINVAVFAIKIGQGLGYEKARLVELGVAALVHDVGMTKIPDEIVNKHGVLSDEEYAQIKKHPQFGYDIIFNSLGEKYKWLAVVVLQEQEREGGQGYPKKLTGNQIHEYAKIIGMVDVYEALSHPRPQRKRFLPYEATKVIVGTSKGMFNPKLIKVLITKLSCFPIGSYVVLNSKAIGKVQETNESSPLRPAIEILYDGMGKKLLEKKIINLRDTPLLYIVDSIFEEDLPK